MDRVPPPAGWYPVGDSERYWDGRAWTDRVRAPDAPPAQRVVYDNHGLPHLVTGDPPPPASSPPPPPSAPLPPPSSPWRSSGPTSPTTSAPKPPPSAFPRSARPGPPPSHPVDAFGRRVGSRAPCPPPYRQPHAPHPRARFGWAGPGAPVRYREPGGPVIASWFMPGLGTLINGEVGRGIAIFVGWVLACAATPFLVLLSELGFAAILVPMVVWGFGLRDGWKSTERWNRRRGWDT